MKYLLLIAPLAVAACADATSPGSTRNLKAGVANMSSTKGYSTGDLPFTVIACNGDVVSGIAHTETKTHFVDTPSGRTISSLDFTLHMEGEGVPSGAKYTLSERDKDKAITGGNGAQVYKTEGPDEWLTGTNGVPPTFVKTSTMLVITPNGDVAVSKFDVSASSCGP